MNSSNPHGESPLYRYRFGSAEFDEARMALSVGGQVVELEQRPLQVLAELLRYPDEVVTREELFESVWAGRPTVDNVLANAVAKLRKALGETEGARIATLPRVGYRLAGPIERHAVGRKLDSKLELKAGAQVPGREHFLLEAQLNPSRNSEVWLARHRKTHEPRVYKFSPDGERLAMLKREITLYRVLRESLGERDDIARILDWNFETPPFFLECEYGGLDLQTWATIENHLATLPLEARVALFLQIADSVAAAHSVGVLHKDLKPANVLVSPRDAAVQDSGWRLRITDFGSGRLLDPERLAELGITRLGLTVTQSIGADSSSGTPLYLAPEVLAGQAPTVQSDIFALGLMLYQLAIGDLRKPMSSGWEQDVTDDLLREDIAAATDGNPARRLTSVAELAERLRTRETRWAERSRLLEVEARAVAAERALERAGARRPWLIAAMALLTLGFCTSLWFQQRAMHSEQRLEQQIKIVRAVNMFMTRDLIGAANPNVSGRVDISVMDVARAAMSKIDSAFAADSPDVQAALHRAMQEALSGLSDSNAATAEGRKAIAAYLMTRPLDLLGLTEARVKLAADLTRLSKNDEAVALLDEVEADLPKLVQAYPELQARYWATWSLVKSDQLDLKGSLYYDKKALALLQTLPDAPADLRNRVEFSLADTLRLLGNYRESEGLQRILVSRQAITLGPKHPHTLYSMSALANSLVYQRRFDEATVLLNEAIGGLMVSLGPTHRRTLMAKEVLATADFMQGKYVEAGQLYEQLSRGFAERQGENSQAAITALMNFGMATHYAGDARAAEGIFRRALVNGREAYDEEDPQTQVLRYHLADCLLDLRRPIEASPLLVGLTVEALNQAEQAPDWEGRLAFQTGRAELQSGRVETALPLLEKAAAIIGAKNRETDGSPLSKVRVSLDAARRQLARTTRGGT